jgi:DNA-binding phage protein
VDRRLVSQRDIVDETIAVTFGNGTSGEYPVARVKVKFDGEEYVVNAAAVQGLAEDVLLGRDVPLHKHMAHRLPRREQMELLQKLAEINKMELKKTLGGEGVKAILTRSQKKMQSVPSRIQEDDVRTKE